MHSWVNIASRVQVIFDLIFRVRTNLVDQISFLWYSNSLKGHTYVVQGVLSVVIVCWTTLWKSLHLMLSRSLSPNHAWSHSLIIYKCKALLYCNFFTILFCASLKYKIFVTFLEKSYLLYLIIWCSEILKMLDNTSGELIAYRFLLLLSE